MSTLLIQFKLVYGLFGQSKMQSTLDFCPRPARRKTMQMDHYIELTVLIYTMCLVRIFQTLLYEFIKVIQVVEFLTLIY